MELAQSNLSGLAMGIFQISFPVRYFGSKLQLHPLSLLKCMLQIVLFFFPENL